MATLALVNALKQKSIFEGSLHGVFGIEDLFTLDELRPDLEAKGIRIKERGLP